MYKKELQNEAISFCPPHYSCSIILDHLHRSSFTAVLYSHRVHARLILHASLVSLRWYLSCIPPLLLGEPLWVKHLPLFASLRSYMVQLLFTLTGPRLLTHLALCIYTQPLLDLVSIRHYGTIGAILSRYTWLSTWHSYIIEGRDMYTRWRRFTWAHGPAFRPFITWSQRSPYADITSPVSASTQPKYRRSRSFITYIWRQWR
jgi:hypothetical protein